MWKSPTARLAAPIWGAAARLLPRTGRASEKLRSRIQSACEEFYALRDVSFEVRRGESLGIIGRNGAGKSTLLQMIAGTLQPTEGTVDVRGRVAALLELGSGFNPDFTGRENVYLNATVLGLSRRQIDERFGAIADFAEIGEFIERPVSTYSSGMVMRLAFSVAAHVEPDILIVDEALAVGDARFQLKCARAIDRFVSQGVTLLFVSHDPTMVKRLCKHAILLERGQLVYIGRPNDVTNLYSKLISDGGSAEALAEDIAALDRAAAERRAAAGAPDSRGGASDGSPGELGGVPSSPEEWTSAGATAAQIQSLRKRLEALEAHLASQGADPELDRKTEVLRADENRHIQVSGKEFAYGGNDGRISRISVHDADGQERTWFTTGERAVVRMVVEAEDNYPEPIFALTVRNRAGIEIYGTNTLFSRQPAPPMQAGDRREVRFTLDLNLMPGPYFLSFGFTHFVGEDLVVAHRRYDAVKIDVNSNDRTFGIANLKAVIESRDAQTTN
jgi:ABC-type polysaccharide/polyol phosphate transport system ATPase subunit